MKQPRRLQNKSRSDIATEMLQKQTAQRRKKIVSSVLFPILLKHSKSIKQAEQFADIFKVNILMQMQKPYKDKSVGALDFSEDIAKDKGEGQTLFTELVESFKDISIVDTMAILADFSQGINNFLTNEKNTRQLSDIKLEQLI